MSVKILPACGLYRTIKPIGSIEAGRLVYFHNHGDPGAGLYLPESWTHNRARFAPQGRTVPEDLDAGALHPLPAEGFYRVGSSFHCCPQRCVEFQPEQLVQLGYNGAGKAILFVPELRGGVIAVPERGTAVDDGTLGFLVALRLHEAPGTSAPRGIMVH